MDRQVSMLSGSAIQLASAALPASFRIVLKNESSRHDA